MLEAIDAISGQLKDAAVDTSAWATALDSINSFAGASGVILLSADQRLKYAPCSADLSEMMDDYFRDGWYANDRREGCLPLLKEKGLVFDYEFQDRHQIEQYYDEFLGRHKRKWFVGLGAYLDGDLWCLAFQRSPALGPFDQTDLTRLAALRARFAEAAIISRAIGSQWIAGALAAFDSDSSAALALNRDGKILELNNLARLIVGGSADGKTGSNRITKLELAFRACLLRAPVPLGHKTIWRVDINNRQFDVEVRPTIKNQRLLFNDASYIVKLCVAKKDPAYILSKEYGLTKAEIQVALRLSNGAEVNDIAEGLAISANTVRAHLKAAYSKTGARGQLKLALLVARFLDGDTLRIE